MTASSTPPHLLTTMAAAPDAPGGDGDGYEAVTGLDAQTQQLKREYEAEVEAKVASDYSHIVWAYGIMWSLFCAFGIAMLLRAQRQHKDLEALRREIHQSRGG